MTASEVASVASLAPDESERLSAREILERLASSESGLSADEAARRLVAVGPNAIVEKKRRPILHFLSFFWGPIAWMIEAAATFAGIVRDFSDLGIISGLLVVNAIIGFWQDYRAGSAIEALKAKLSPKARVRRDARWSQVAADTLVPGDVVRVRLGDVVPADLKLMSGGTLEIDQSVLTGESLPVERKPGEVAYSGSILKRGEADAIVVATGMATYFGRTARLVQEKQRASHYQRAVLSIGRFLIFCTIALVVLIFIFALVRHEPILKTIEFVLVLTVAAIPVALPAVLSVTMAVGALRLSRMQAIVSRLVSIEEMAGMDLLCSDKTGTLTQSRLVIGEPVTFGGHSADEVIGAASLASRAEDQDPIDLAVLARADSIPAAARAGTVEAFHPFDPTTKRTEARVRRDGGRSDVTKGAPQVVLALCRSDSSLSQKVSRAVEEMAARGDRALGVARREGEDDWQLLGLLPMFDPPREDSASTLAELARLGVAVKMVTGDHLAIAREIARKLHMGDAIVPAPSAFGEGRALDAAELEKADGFAQVFPEHKYRLVEALQQRGHFVGMTGDGVNDAPALKRADMGIAVSGATDAARSAADLVLTAPGLSVIARAIEESRRIFKRMQSYAIYRISETIRVLLFMTLAILFFRFYPVTATMIVILALINDLPIMMIAYDHADLPERPVRWKMSFVLGIAILLGVIGLIESFLLFVVADRVFHLDRGLLQTLIFLKLAVAGHMTIYLTRTGIHHFWQRPFPSTALIAVCEGTQVIATLFAVYGVLMKPIGWIGAGIVWAYALCCFLLNDMVKVAARHLVRAIRSRRAHATPAPSDAIALRGS